MTSLSSHTWDCQYISNYINTGKCRKAAVSFISDFFKINLRRSHSACRLLEQADTDSVTDRQCDGQTDGHAGGGEVILYQS